MPRPFRKSLLGRDPPAPVPLQLNFSLKSCGAPFPLEGSFIARKCIGREKLPPGRAGRTCDNPVASRALAGTQSKCPALRQGTDSRAYLQMVWVMDVCCCRTGRRASL